MRKEAEDNPKEAEVKDILASHGIYMTVGGCGCCGSPWVKMIYNGRQIVDEDAFCFSMEVPPNPGVPSQ